MAKSLKIPIHKTSAMNTEPMTYPTALPSTLSADARTLYERARRSGSSWLDRDVFDPQTLRRYLSEDEKKAFIPTERMLTAIDELCAAGLATYYDTYGYSLHIHPVREDYTIAQGRGSSMITVSTFDESPDQAVLLGTILGGDIENRSSGGYNSVPELTIRARHEDATDFEESASSTARLVLRNPSPPQFNGGGIITFTGVLTEAHLYPLGLDPLTYDDGETRVGGTCTRCETPHRFAAYLPPELPLDGPQFVLVRVIPMSGYQVAAPPAYDRPAAEDGDPA